MTVTHKGAYSYKVKVTVNQWFVQHSMINTKEQYEDKYLIARTEIMLNSQRSIFYRAVIK